MNPKLLLFVFLCCPVLSCKHSSNSLSSVKDSSEASVKTLILNKLGSSTRLKIKANGILWLKNQIDDEPGRKRYFSLYLEGQKKSHILGNGYGLFIVLIKNKPTYKDFGWDAERVRELIKYNELETAVEVEEKEYCWRILKAKADPTTLKDSRGIRSDCRLVEDDFLMTRALLEKSNEKQLIIRDQIIPKFKIFVTVLDPNN